MNKPIYDNRASFYVFDKDIAKFKPLKTYSNEQLLGIVDTLLKDIKTHEFNYRNDYFQIYNLYQQALNFEIFYNTKKDDAIYNLNALKNDLAHDKKINDLSILQSMYLNYRYNTIFKKDWFLTPAIYFSNEFYKTALTQKSASILLMSYQFDSTNTDNNDYMPIFKLLANEDKYVIQPHYITQKNAQHLLRDIKTPDEHIPNLELKLFKMILKKVSKNEAEIVVYNDDF